MGGTAGGHEGEANVTCADCKKPLGWNNRYGYCQGCRNRHRCVLCCTPSAFVRPGRSAVCPPCAGVYRGIAAAHAGELRDAGLKQRFPGYAERMATLAARAAAGEELFPTGVTP